MDAAFSLLDETGPYQTLGSADRADNRIKIDEMQSISFHDVCYTNFCIVALDMTLTMGVVARLNLVYWEFGLLLAGERKRKHLTQAQFGARVGLSRTSVTNIECGRQPVQLHQLYLFASVLQITAQALLPREPPTEQVERKEMANNQAQYLVEAKKHLPQAAKTPIRKGAR